MTFGDTRGQKMVILGFAGILFALLIVSTFRDSEPARNVVAAAVGFGGLSFFLLVLGLLRDWGRAPQARIL
jgi:hypothetical protein